jgi:hypothetical protein
MMYRKFYLPSYDELSFFCFPSSAGKFSRPDKHIMNRDTGLRDFSLHFVVEAQGTLNQIIRFSL